MMKANCASIDVFPMNFLVFKENSLIRYLWPLQIYNNRKLQKKNELKQKSYMEWKDTKALKTE